MAQYGFQAPPSLNETLFDIFRTEAPASAADMVDEGSKTEEDETTSKKFYWMLSSFANSTQI